MNTPTNDTAEKLPAPEKTFPVAFAVISDWTKISGMSRTGTYSEIANGNLRAKKQGKRTLIDVRHGLAWIDSLPTKLAKQRNA